MPTASRSFRISSRLCKPLAGRSGNAKNALAQMSVVEDLYRYIISRENLKPATSLVLLEDILERHQDRITHSRASDSEIKAILALGQFYVEDLMKAKRPIAATQFLRNLATALRNRVKTRERYAEGRMAFVLENLYRLLRDYGGNPTERWNVINEANEILEKLSPEDWEPDAPRSLRIQRAQVLQYYNAEEDILSDDPSTRRIALERLIRNHEKVLQLESGIKSQRSDVTRLRSLRAICSLKEEKGGHEDYRVYAQEYHTLMRSRYAEALVAGLDVRVAHEYLTGYVILCQAQLRAKKWAAALKTASEGLEKAEEIGWPEGYGSQVERCQLYVHRSWCHMKLKMPNESLADARDAVAMADAIPWNDTHPDPEVARDYPTAYRKQHWCCFALSNFADTVYDGQVQAPEERFGLLAAERGLSLLKGKVKDPDHEYYEPEFRSKKIRALRKLKQWNNALAECRDLSKQLTQTLPTSKQVRGLAQQLVEVYEDAASCFEGMGHKDLGEKLFDKVDTFAGIIEKEMPLHSYVAKANDLQATFDTMYKGVTDVPILGYLSGWFNKGQASTGITKANER